MTRPTVVGCCWRLNLIKQETTFTSTWVQPQLYRMSALRRAESLHCQVSRPQDRPLQRTASVRSTTSEAAQQAFERTVYRTPYSQWHRHVGEADGVISSLSNTERMFSYYPDAKKNPRSSSCDRSEGSRVAGAEARSASSTGEASSHGGAYHSDSEDKPAVRWRTSQGMSLWGSMRHLTTSPNSHNTGARGNPLQRQASSSTLSGAGGRRLDVSGNGEESDSMEEMREGAATRSFGVNDCENLSDAMKRSLKALNMLPYKGPSGLGGPAGSGKGWLYKPSSSGMVSHSELDSSASTARLVDRAAIVKKTSVAAEAALMKSKDKKKDNKGAQDMQAKRKGGTKPQRPTDLYGVISRPFKPGLEIDFSGPAGARLGACKKHAHFFDLIGAFQEFVRMRDCMDCGNGCGGIKVGFGGLGLLAEHVEKGLVTSATPLCIEVEFCTHGYDGVSRGNKDTSKYYNHYMHVCDVIEDALYPAWNVAFIIKKGKPRAGSFEVELLWIVGSVEYAVTLASKMCNSKFPSAQKIRHRLEVALGIVDK